MLSDTCEFRPSSRVKFAYPLMRQHPQGRDAALIGHAVSAHKGMVLLKTEVGGTRLIDLPFTEQLPRIC